MINKQRCKEGFAPAIKNKRGKVFLPDGKNEIHSDIYERIEPFNAKELKLMKSDKEYWEPFFRRMKREGYIEGFVILKTGKFLTRNQMEKAYGNSETCSLRTAINFTGLEIN